MANQSPPGLSPPGGSEGGKIRLVEPLRDVSESDSEVSRLAAQLPAPEAVQQNLPVAQWNVIKKTLERILGHTELFDVLVSELGRVLETGEPANTPQNTPESSLPILPGMVYRSDSMRELAEQIYKTRDSRMSVLITGESGTGKEGIARAIHLLSQRKLGPFVAFNCTMVTRELISSQLFGHRKGAFTGANSNYRGSIRSAEGGTIFLDEIGDLPIELQPKLLRFLQEGEVHPVGETRPVKVNVRVIAATNRDIETMVARGEFREDLYYRINVLRFHVPSLRERREEIPILANHLLDRFSTDAEKKGLSFSPAALASLMASEWPGNIRQLANEIQRAIAMVNSGELIKPYHLSPAIAPRKPGKTDWLEDILARSSFVAAAPETETEEETGESGKTLASDVVDLEKHRIVQTLEKLNGNLSRSARELGLTRRGLYLKMARYDIDPKLIKRAKAQDEEPA